AARQAGGHHAAGFPAEATPTLVMSR
ncbi:integration host factor subunit beta, partial [Ralstonia pseudosolanacearum]